MERDPQLPQWEEASKGGSCFSFASEQEGRAGKMQLPDLTDINQPRLAWGHLQLEYLLSQHTHGAAEGRGLGKETLKV